MSADCRSQLLLKDVPKNYIHVYIYTCVYIYMNIYIHICIYMFDSAEDTAAVATNPSSWLMSNGGKSSPGTDLESVIL